MEYVVLQITLNPREQYIHNDNICVHLCIMCLCLSKTRDLRNFDIEFSPKYLSAINKEFFGVYVLIFYTYQYQYYRLSCA